MFEDEDVQSLRNIAKDEDLYSQLNCFSEYVIMRDGVSLAVSYWSPADLTQPAHENYPPRPVILSTTRYWRAMAYKDDRPEYQPYYRFASYAWKRGYILVAVDVRGTGASFGWRESEIPDDEVEDLGELIDWIASRWWCDGRIFTEGTSYTANTAIASLVTAPDALKGVVCRAPDFDTVRHLCVPGGVFNKFFIDDWGAATRAQDRNDAASLFAEGSWPEHLGGASNILGVRPVDEDIEEFLLKSAIADHQVNYRMEDAEKFAERSPFIDQFPTVHAIFDERFRSRIDNCNRQLVVRCGWHDAGTALGALSMFNTLKTPIKIQIGPWNHAGNSLADPFASGGESTANEVAPEDVYGSTLDEIDTIINQTTPPETTSVEISSKRKVEYYTLGEGRWKETAEWPPNNAIHRRFFFAENNSLSFTEPDCSSTNDPHQIDSTATTGTNNRWHTQMAGKSILFPDRASEDRKLLVYDSLPLDEDLEVTGHSQARIWLRSSASDFNLFVYLECIDKAGKVTLLTEGQLRALHRKTSDSPPPYHMYGPYHSLLKQDAMEIQPDEIALFELDLFPISVRLKKGWQIRVAIAGADNDTFAPVQSLPQPDQTIWVERSGLHASHVELPLMPISRDQPHLDEGVRQ